MLTVLIIVWILWRLSRPWYGGWYRPPMGGHHYHHAPMGGWRRPPMSGFHGGGFHGGFGGAFGGGHTAGGGAGRGRR